MGVRLKEKPFNLSGEQITFLHDLMEQMTLDEKIGQLFLPINFIEDEQELTSFIKKFQPGGSLNRPVGAANNLRKHNIMQRASKIPMFIAANAEAGGNGAAAEGTSYGNPLEVAATGDTSFGYGLGKVCGVEGRAIGVNFAFAPIIDIDFNTLNPITNTRTFGNKPETVYQMAKAYIRGLQEDGQDMAYSIKHFPGDGVDHRDQHLHITYNTLNVEEWENTYGHNYRRLIDEGATAVMVGHIGLPAYVKEINPEASKKELLMPGSLSKEIVTGLLRERMNFNGVVFTDSTSMNGFYAAMSRRQAVPTAIANGCDVFLFNFDVEEDYRFMKEGIENGLLSMERVDEAVTRVIALKLAMGLFDKQKDGSLYVSEENISILGNEKHQKLAAECADRAVTLVKDEEKLLPISPEKEKRILLYVMGDREDFYGNKKVGDMFAEAMEKEGFQISRFCYDNPFGNVTPTTAEIAAHYDAAIYILSEGTSSNQTTVRLTWNLPLANDAPWFVHDIPTMAISFANPYHLRDMPEITTFINAYTTSEFTVKAVVDKLLGRSEFTGVNPVDTSCGLFELNL